METKELNTRADEVLGLAEAEAAKLKEIASELGSAERSAELLESAQRIVEYAVEIHDLGLPFAVLL